MTLTPPRPLMTNVIPMNEKGWLIIRLRSRKGTRIARCVPWIIVVECREVFSHYRQLGTLKATLSYWKLSNLVDWVMLWRFVEVVLECVSYVSRAYGHHLSLVSSKLCEILECLISF